MITLEQLSPLGIGTSRIGSLGSRMSPRQFDDFLEIATAQGVNLIDTSDAYGSGDSERLIGGGIRGDRGSFFVMTKAGLPCVHTPGWLSPLNQIGKKIKQKAGVKKNYGATYLLKSLQKSIARLGIEQADAFMLHEPDWSDISRNPAGEDAWAGLEKIRARGLSRYTGVSTNDYRVVEEGIKSGQVQVVQTAVAWNDKGADALIELCRKNNIPVVANQVLRPYQSALESFKKEADFIHQLKGLSGMSLAQFLIAAALVQKHVRTVLVGTTNPAHLEHNLNTLRYTTELKDQLTTVNQLLS